MSEPQSELANRPIGLFGGSFDPVHNAHLQLAHAALATFALQSVRWLPNSLPGHREGPRASAADRLAMLRLALQDEPRFAIDESEIWQTEPTYTINTLHRLRESLGRDVSLVFIIGADHLLGLHLWRDWEKLFELTHFAVAERPGHEIRASAMTAAVAAQYSRRLAPASAVAAAAGGCIVGFPVTPMDLSSNSIRAAIAGNANSAGSLPEALPAAVLDYIESKHLYQANT